MNMALLALYFLAGILSLPLTFFVMLFVGNIGHPFSYLALYPGVLAFVVARTALSTAVNK